MKYKQYSPEIWTKLNSAIEQATAADPHPVAAFDADGTLWDTDFGENYFHHKIDHKLVPLPEDPWNYYVELKKKNSDPRTAYLWLAQILKGIPLETARKWAVDAKRAHAPTPYFPDQQKLIELLLSKGVHVYVVTASVKWAVEPGALELGIPLENVLGVETAVHAGHISDQAAGTMTYRQGKAEAIARATGGKKPFLAAGNTTGDLELLESATHVRLAVSAAARDDRLFKAEDELAKIAKDRGWLSHRWVEGA